jgi:RimJ/RimL family protein N-acetyltransferase
LDEQPVIATARLNLFALEERHFEPLAEMHQDPDVMATLGGLWSRAQTRKAFDRYVAAFARDGISRFAVEDKAGNFLGLAGALRHLDESQAPGRHDEIGWRFTRTSWGKGFATEASRAALEHAFAAADCAEIWAYTIDGNARSQAVMSRLGMQRDAAKDFTLTAESGRIWDLKVWTAQRG